MGVDRPDRAVGPRVSLRLRLTLWVVAVYTMIQWATGGVFSMYQALSIRTMFDQRLAEEAESLVGAIAPVIPGIDRRSLDRIAADEVHRRQMDPIIIDVLGADGVSVVVGDRSPIDASKVPVAAVLGTLDEVFFDLEAPVVGRRTLGPADATARAGNGLSAGTGPGTPAGDRSGERAPEADGPSGTPGTAGGAGPVGGAVDGAVGGAVVGEGAAGEFGEQAEYADRAVAMSMLGADLESYVLVVSRSDEHAEQQLALVRRIFLVSAIVGPLVAGLAGWFIAGIAVAPLERLRRMAKKFGPNSLDQTFEMPTANKEVAALTAQLEDARVRIREAFAAQERFLTNVSHELKTPIAVLMIEADTLRLDDAPEEVVSFVSSAREEMSKLGRLMESFLMLTRLHENRTVERGKRYVVNDLVMDAVDDCGAMAAQHGVRLSAELLSEESELEAEVSGDYQLLRTMLENLVRTALRFTPRGKRVTVGVQLIDGRARVTVSDEGAAIPCEEIDVIFDRFSESGMASKNGRGYGLGLAIAQGIAELHGGRIRAVNLDGGGCEFAAELPLATSAAGAAR